MSHLRVDLLVLIRKLSCFPQVFGPRHGFFFEGLSELLEFLVVTALEVDDCASLLLLKSKVVDAVVILIYYCLAVLVLSEARDVMCDCE